MLRRFIIFIAFHAFNGLFLLFSIGMAGLGCFLSQSTVRHRYTAAFTFVTGFATMFASLVGCFAVVRKHTCAILLYIIMVFLFVIGMVLFGVILLFASSDHFAIQNSEKDIDVVFGFYAMKDRMQVFINRYQEKHQCCGVNGPTYWVKNTSLGYVPASCCDDFHDFHCNEMFAYQKPCKSVWLKQAKFTFRVSTAILWAGAVVGLVCFILAIVLRKKFKDKERPAEKKNPEKRASILSNK